MESNPNVLFLNWIIGLASRKSKERVNSIKGGLLVVGIKRFGQLQLVICLSAIYGILKDVLVDFAQSKFCAKSDIFGRLQLTNFKYAFLLLIFRTFIPEPLLLIAWDLCMSLIMDRG